MKMKRKKIKTLKVTFLLSIFSLLSLAFLYLCKPSFWKPAYLSLTGQKTISNSQTEARNYPEKEYFYPTAEFETFPEKLSLLAFKREKILEIWGLKGEKWYYIKSYTVLAASGTSGPKLKEGDRQVPEGVYKIIMINHESDFHIAMLIDYPNEFDREKAELEGRTGLGGDICIHGNAVSIGCIAIGDGPVEELSAMVEKAGMENIKVIIAPHDFRKELSTDDIKSDLPWLPELYEIIKKELKYYPIKEIDKN